MVFIATSHEYEAELDKKLIRGNAVFNSINVVEKERCRTVF